MKKREQTVFFRRRYPEFVTFFSTFQDKIPEKVKMGWMVDVEEYAHIDESLDCEYYEFENWECEH